MSTLIASIPIPSSTSTGVHSLDPHLTIEWLYDGAIANLVLTDNNRKSVDMFIDTTIQILKTAPKDQKLLFLLDVSALSGTTMHLKTRLKDIRKSLQDEQKFVRAAVVIPSGGLGLTLFLLLKQVVSSRLSADVGDELFQSREKGLQWLLDALSKDN